MDKVAILFPSDNPGLGIVSPTFVEEYRACSKQDSFEIALYNHDAFLAGARLKVVPIASAKTVYCLVRGASMSLEDYERLCKELKYFGFKPIVIEDACWDLYHDEMNYLLPSGWEHLALNFVRIDEGDRGKGWTWALKWLEELGPFVLRDRSGAIMSGDTPQVFEPPENMTRLDEIIDIAADFKKKHNKRYALLSENVVAQPYQNIMTIDGIPAEWRAYYFDGQLFYLCPKKDSSLGTDLITNSGFLERLEQDIVPFCAMDLVLTENGNWRCLRYFDGQFSSVPAGGNVEAFYKNLAQVVSSSPHIPEWSWCLVGDIVEKHPFGKQKLIVRGSKHFYPGTKVYIACELGGNGWERVCVLGIPRYTDKLVSVMMPIDLICNLRLEKVYDKKIIASMKNGHLGQFFCLMNPAQIRFGWDNSDESLKVINILMKSIPEWQRQANNDQETAQSDQGKDAVL